MCVNLLDQNQPGKSKVRSPDDQLSFSPFGSCEMDYTMLLYDQNSRQNLNFKQICRLKMYPPSQILGKSHCYHLDWSGLFVHTP